MYVPRARADDATFTMNVELLLVMVVVVGVTDNHFEPVAMVTVGLIVTPPVQLPEMLIVKLCDAGLGLDPN